MRLIDLDIRRRLVWISYPYDAQITAIVKSIPERRFDKPTRRWCVPLRQVAVVLHRLDRLQFTYTPRMRDWWREHRDTLPAPAENDAAADQLVDPEDGYTVARLNAAARAVLADHFDTLWVVAEVDGYARNKADGHAYFELVDRIGGEPVARVRAVMFAAARQRIVDALRPDIEFQDGLRLRLQGSVDLYTTTGSFQFIVEAVDVDWTVGARRRKRDEVLDKLTKQGIASANLNRPLSLLPLRVGLITAAESDAYNDFVHELERSGIGFNVLFCPAQVQGHAAEVAIGRALDALAGHDLDVIVITRGGGARGDLAAFDSYDVARRVCELNVKVVVGIGHHRDQSVLDFVATAEKTPTAAAQLLVQRVVAARDRVDGSARRLLDAATLRTTAAHRHVERLGQLCVRRTADKLHRTTRQLDAVTSRCVSATNDTLSHNQRRAAHAVRAIGRAATTRLDLAQRNVDRAEHAAARHAAARTQRAANALERATLALLHHARNATTAHTARLNTVEATVRMAHPARILERGFALIRDVDDRIITDAAQLSQLDTARVELRDGRVEVHLKGDE